MMNVARMRSPIVNEHEPREIAISYKDRRSQDVREGAHTTKDLRIGVIHRLSSPFPRTPNPPRGSAPRNAALRLSYAEGSAPRCSPQERSTLNRSVFGPKNGDHLSPRPSSMKRIYAWLTTGS
jgi:hypothetical protein